jgi:hypothetical protein
MYQAPLPLQQQSLIAKLIFSAAHLALAGHILYPRQQESPNVYHNTYTDSTAPLIML